MGLNNSFFGWKHYKNSGFGTFSKRKKGPKLTKLLSWKSVQGCVENPSKYVAQHNWTNFQRKKLCFFLFFFFYFFFYFFEKSHSPCRKKKIFENKNRKTKKNDGFSTQKRAVFGRIFNSTAHIYIYVYISSLSLSLSLSVFLSFSLSFFLCFAYSFLSVIISSFLSIYWSIYLSIYIYIYAVELKTGPRFGVSSVKNWSKSRVKNWSKFLYCCFSPVL